MCPVNGEAVAEPATFSAEGWSQLRFLAPPGCVLCGAPFELAQPKGTLCVPCAAPSGFERGLCGPRRLDGVRSALIYDDASAGLVLSLKYGDRHEVAPALARLMVPALAALRAPRDAALLPVPLHRTRLRERRFNQSALLAEGLAAWTERTHEPLLLKRTKATPRQKGLSVGGRFRNISGAFEAVGSLKGRNFILVDDVLTSGATLIGCARALRRAGAQSVHAVTVARVFPEAKDAQMDLDES